MPTITVRCKCGELLRVSDQGVGEKLKCRRCGRSGEVRHSHRTIEAQAGDALRRAGKSGSRKASSGEAPTSDVSRLLHRVRQRTQQRAMSWLVEHKRSQLVARSLAVSPRLATLTHVLTLASWAFLAFACIVAIMLWGLGDKWWPATILLFIGRWIFLLPIIVLVPAAIVFRRTLLVPILLATIIVVGPVMGFRAGWGRLLPHESGLHFRVVTFNADGGDQIADILPVLLTQWEPDVAAFQECGTSLAEATHGLAGWYHHDVRGLCLISRYPIRTVSVMNRDALERVHEDESAGVGGAGYVARYAIQTPRGTINFTNLHLETPRKGLEGLLGGFSLRRLRLNTQLRDIESDLARRWVDQGRDRLPLLVAGDFNTPVESRIFQQHWGDLTDAFSKAGFGLGMTKYNGWIRVRIDHLLSGPAWHIDNVTIGPDLGSDHRPVITDLTLGSHRESSRLTASAPVLPR